MTQSRNRNDIQQLQELKNHPNWVDWKYEPNKDGKPRKVPYNPKTGYRAKADDPSTWGTFQQAADALSVMSGNDYEGLGFELGGTDICGIDFDGCVRPDKSIEPFVLAVIDVLPTDSYVEYSPTETGLHGWVTYSGTLPRGKRKMSGGDHSGPEIYHGHEGGRYFTVTCRRFSGSDVPVVTEEQMNLVYLLLRKWADKDERFMRLWLGDGSGCGDGRSDADFALCCELAKAFNSDAQKIEAAFRQSKLVLRDPDKHPDTRPDYLERTITAAIERVASEAASKNPKENSGAVQVTTEEVTSFTAGEITEKKVGWLWKNRFALKLNLLVGNAGEGKSLITHYLTACVTTGRGWIDGQPNDLLLRFKGRRWTPHDEVLILSAEEDWEDTIKPRLMAAEADCSKVHGMKIITIAAGMKMKKRERVLQLDRDIDRLEEFLENHPRVGLVIIDPVSSYLGKAKMIDEQGVRAVLTPLKEVADRHQAAIVGVMHLNKKVDLEAIHRISGAVAFVGVARMVWLVAPRPVLEPADDYGEMVMVKVKGNIVKRKLQGLTFVTRARQLQLSDGTEEAAFVDWTGHINAQADELAGKPAHPVRHSAGRPPLQRTEAAQWLREFLADGAKTRAEIMHHGKQEGHSEKTLVRARDMVGAVAFENGNYMTGKDGKQYADRSWKLMKSEAMF